MLKEHQIALMFIAMAAPKGLRPPVDVQQVYKSEEMLCKRLM